MRGVSAPATGAMLTKSTKSAGRVGMTADSARPAASATSPDARPVTPLNTLGIRHAPVRLHKPGLDLIVVIGIVAAASFQKFVRGGLQVTGFIRRARLNCRRLTVPVP